LARPQFRSKPLVKLIRRSEFKTHSFFVLDEILANHSMRPSVSSGPENAG
jgi:hypothetical protein